MRSFRTTCLALAGAVALASAGCLDPGAAAAPPAGLADELAVRRGTLAPTALLTGELEAEEAVVLSAPNVNIWPLTVRHVVDDGAAVAEGEVVVEFDNSQLLSNLEDMRTQAVEEQNRLDSERSRVAAAIADAEFEVERRRAELKKAEIKADVPADLVSGREHAEAQLAKKRAELELAEAELALAAAEESGEADVRIQEIALDKARDAALRAEQSIDKLSLRAPRDGIVVRGENPMEGRPVRAADTVWPGTTVARLPDLLTLYVKAQLFDVDDGRIAREQKVRASLDAFPDVVIEGVVREIDAVADETGRFSARRFFDVTIDLDEIDPERMRPGMSVKVVVESEPQEDVLLVPREALDLRGETARAATAGGGLVEVELGACDARFCVVRGGLEEGQRLRRAEPRWNAGAAAPAVEGDET